MIVVDKDKDYTVFRFNLLYVLYDTNIIVGFISIPLILAHTPTENKRLEPEKDGLNQSRNLQGSLIFRR